MSGVISDLDALRTIGSVNMIYLDLVQLVQARTIGPMLSADRSSQCTIPNITCTYVSLCPSKPP